METNPASNRMGTIALTAAAVALLAITMGSRSVFGLFLSPLNSATGLGIATISFAVAASQLAWGAAQPLCGLLTERYGPARVIFAGTLLAAATGALLPLADSAGLLVAVLAAGGVAATVGSPSLLVGTVSQRVAPKRRGLVAGIVGGRGRLGERRARARRAVARRAAPRARLSPPGRRVRRRASGAATRRLARRGARQPAVLAGERHLLRLRPARVLPGHASAGRDRVLRAAGGRRGRVARRARAVQHRRQHRRRIRHPALFDAAHARSAVRRARPRHRGLPRRAQDRARAARVLGLDGA